MRTVLLLIYAGTLAGCAAAAPERTGPEAAQAKAAPLEYRSAFENYRPFAEQDLANWRKANDEVGAAGGHAGGQHR